MLAVGLLAETLPTRMVGWMCSRRANGRLRQGFWLGVCAAWTFVLRPAVVQPQPRETPPDGPRKLALIVTIGNYHPTTGWKPIASNADSSLVIQGLTLHGFHRRDIVRLSDANATREAIVQAFRTHLTERARAGDVAVFHYSGHGQQITDDSLDEIDGYDEALAPYDAPMVFANGYAGEKHLRDDELGSLLEELREKLGPQGDAVLFLDSCHSGSMTRGASLAGGLGVRGTGVPNGPPQPRPESVSAARNVGGGFLETRAASPTGAPHLAPFAVFTAERHDRLAEEHSVNGRNVGALSWVIAGVLADSGPETSYRDLLSEVEERTMAEGIPNAPQGEGQLNRAIFGGKAIRQEPFFRVKSAAADGSSFEIDGGELTGVLNNSVVEIHRSGTRKPAPETRLATGTVTRTTPFIATARLDETNSSYADLERGWAFLTEPAYGSLEVKVRLDGEDAAGWKNQVRHAIRRSSSSENSYLKIDSENADLIIGEAAPNTLVVETALHRVRLVSGIDPSMEGFADWIAERLRAYAKHAYLRGLRSQDFDVEFELIPCVLECDSQSVCEYETCKCAAEGSPETTYDEGGNRSFRIGTAFGLKIKNNSDAPLYVSILDLMPDGQIGLLWPLELRSITDSRLQPHQQFRVLEASSQLLVPYRVCPPLGTDVIKLFASTQEVDFGPIVRGSRTRSGTRGPFDILFEDTLSGRRGVRPTIPAGSFGTYAVTIEVVPSPE